MTGRKQTKRALSQLEGVRDIIREAEVELREATYYPPLETRHHLSDAAANLAAAEKALRKVLGLLEASSEEQPPR
jgi:hypothetical protein